MKKIIPIFYSEYGRYINRFRAIPSFIDGLKPVERRVLLSLHKEGRKKAVKSATVIGYALGHLHPHGDACLDYNTEIYSLDGNIYKIGDLCKNKIEKLEVLSLNSKGEIIPAIAHHFRVGKTTTEIYEIKLSNGHYIRCTDNHPIRLKNGNYIQAKDLKLFDFIDSGIICDDDRPKVRTNSSDSMLELIQEIIKKYHNQTNIIHHKDKNIKNNTLTNLDFLTREQHAKLHGDYKIGLEMGRDSMFSKNGKYRNLIQQKNSLLMKEYNKHQTIFKAFQVVRHIENQGHVPTHQLYNQYRYMVYNAPYIETLIKKGKITNFDDLLNLEKTFKLDTTHATNLTGKYNKPPRRSYNSSENAVTLNLLKQISKIIEYIITNYCRNNGSLLSYNQVKKILIQKYGLGNLNITNRIYPTEATLMKYFKTTDLDELSVIVSKNGFLTYIEDIKIIKFDHSIEMFDFTVDNFENMYIVTGKENDIIYISNVHNSLYGTLANMVNQGYAKGEGNWGSPGLEDDPPAAMRYTEVYLKKWVDDLAFTYLDEKYVPYQEFELEPEPIYLPSPIPIGLIGHGVITGISFYRTIIPKYKLSDLLKRLLWILHGKKKKEEVIIQPNSLDCTVSESETGDFQKILTTGVGSINYTPHGKLETKNLRIQGRAPNSSFGSLINDQENLDINIIDQSSDHIDILVEPRKKSTNLNTLATSIWKNHLIKKLNFNCLFCDNDGNVESYGIDDILSYNYSLWKYSVQLKNIDDFNKLSNRKVELMIVQIIRYIFEQYKSNTVDEIITHFKELKKNSDISIEIDIFDVDKNIWKKEIKQINEQDIVDICNKRTIKNLVETVIDIQKVEKELSSAKSLIDTCEKNCLNYITELVKEITA